MAALHRYVGPRSSGRPVEGDLVSYFRLVIRFLDYYLPRQRFRLSEDRPNLRVARGRTGQG